MPVASLIQEECPAQGPHMRRGAPQTPLEGARAPGGDDPLRRGRAKRSTGDTQTAKTTDHPHTRPHLPPLVGLPALLRPLALRGALRQDDRHSHEDGDGVDEQLHGVPHEVGGRHAVGDVGCGLLDDQLRVEDDVACRQRASERAQARASW